MKRIISLLLALALLVSMACTAFAQEPEQTAEPFINQIYGGGGKSETPILNSFVELYNPSATAVDLSVYSLVYGDKTLALSGAIPASGSYLIVGAQEATSEEYLTYDLPEADLTCDWVINNKTYTIKLMKGETEIDSVTAGDSAATKVSKQKSLKRNSDGSFSIIVWEKGEVVVDEAYIAANAPRNSKGESGTVHGASPDYEPVYTPVVTGDSRVKGFFNGTGAIDMELAGRYNSGAMNADGGSLEIVAYNPKNGYAYAVSGVKGKLIAVDVNVRSEGDKATELAGTEYDVKKLISGFAYGDMTSVSVSPDGSRIAVAIQAENYADNGAVALFSCEDDGSLTLLSTVIVGVQPDMLTFADNNTILTADEGEPRNGAGAADPKGSVTIVTIGADNSLSANSVYFDSFDEKRDELTAAGVLVQKGKNPSEDFEPEYIAVSGNTAFVSLQEANAVAVLDIAAGTLAVYQLDCVHTPEELYSKDETGHWKNCTACGEKLDFAAHISDGGVVTTAPTATTSGLKTYSCKDCGYVIKTETIPAAGNPQIPSRPNYPIAPTNPSGNTTATTSQNTFSKKITAEAKAEGNTVTLSWDKVDNADKYISIA